LLGGGAEAAVGHCVLAGLHVGPLDGKPCDLLRDLNGSLTAPCLNPQESLNQVQFFSNDWFTVSIWTFEPRHLSRFLTLAYAIANADDEENRSLIRVRRLPYSYGAAEWEFDGEHHFEAVY